MDEDTYLTVDEPGAAQVRVLGSRFLASVYPIVIGESEVAENIERVRRTYHDATHHCFAYRIGLGSNLVERSSDSGEPKGTAGVPILRELQGRDLTDTLVTVTRYFGGTKLGKGNLARAYADAARGALAASTVVSRLTSTLLEIDCPFEIQAMVYRIAHRYGASTEPRLSSENASFQVQLRSSSVDDFCHSLLEETRGQASIRRVGS
jgi:uncharacterized YigZ family protein